MFSVRVMVRIRVRVRVRVRVRIRFRVRVMIKVRVRVRVRFRQRVSDNITFRPLKIFVNTSMAQTSTNLWALRPILSGLGLGLGLRLEPSIVYSRD